ncbi:uncharacterized protein LOC121052157 isoform X2 [Rosa chinensis]|uniref:uncharacterized protein LOC121052157 isoform X2 n=1 Tax=Rosa chinensis TaxID=74649 RepID=UPI001AD94CD8|nr:uncharacterized protein LOC121052157 isoform X2 [Rosa chinensis]
MCQWNLTRKWYRRTSDTDRSLRFRLDRGFASGSVYLTSVNPFYYDAAQFNFLEAVPLLKKAIVKKRVEQFKRPQSDCKICVRFCSFLRLNCSQKAWRSGFFHRRAIDSLLQNN